MTITTGNPGFHSGDVIFHDMIFVAIYYIIVQKIIFISLHGCDVKFHKEGYLNLSRVWWFEMAKRLNYIE